MKIETPTLKRLGPIPFWRGENRCLDSLETMYKRAMAKAMEMGADRKEPAKNGVDGMRRDSRHQS